GRKAPVTSLPRLERSQLLQPMSPGSRPPGIQRAWTSPAKRHVVVPVAPVFLDHPAWVPLTVLALRAKRQAVLVGLRAGMWRADSVPIGLLKSSRSGGAVLLQPLLPELRVRPHS